MNVVRTILLFTLFALPISDGFAVGFIDGAECVSWDEVHNRYLVSSFWNGRIVALDTNKTQSIFASGLGHCYGNLVKGNTLFVSWGQGVWILDLNTGAALGSVTLSGAGQNDGLAADTSGYLYTVDMDSRVIFRIKLQDLSYTVFVSSGLPVWPQTMVFDAPRNRLLLVSYAPSAPILAIRLSDGGISTVVVTPFGYSDGIAQDQYGYTYVGCTQGDAVYRYDSSFANPPRLLLHHVDFPTELCYNQRDHMLAIPCFDADSVVFFRDLYHHDSDADSVVDLFDNCPLQWNPLQEDLDGDSVGNVCDNCVSTMNPDQADADNNGIGDACDYLCGDADDSGIITISDAVYLIGYIFGGGPAPNPVLAGDADCNGIITISDAVYLINYIFAGGPAPCAACP